MNNTNTDTIKHKLITVGGIVLALYGIAWSWSNISQFVYKLWPGNDFMGLGMPTFFDLAFLVWIGMLVYVARGTWQRVIALVWALAAFIAIAGINWYWLTYSSKIVGSALTLAERADIVEWALRLFEGAALATIAGKVLFFLADPNIQRAIKLQMQVDRTVDQAIKDAEGLMANVREEAAQRLADTMRADALAKLEVSSKTRLSDLAGKQPHRKDVSEVKPSSNGHAKEPVTNFTTPANP